MRRSASTLPRRKLLQISVNRAFALKVDNLIYLGEEAASARAYHFTRWEAEKANHRHRHRLPAQQNPSASFNYVIGKGKQRQCNVDAERVGSLEVDRQLESDGLLDRQLGRFGSLQYPVYITRTAKKQIREVWPVRYEAAGRHRVSCLIHARQPTLVHKSDDFF